MSAITDKARDFWDRISPRERRLVVHRRGRRPAHDRDLARPRDPRRPRRDGARATTRSRKALDVLADLRARGQTHAAGRRRRRDDGHRAAVSLDTYLSTRRRRRSSRSRARSRRATPVTRNGFVTNTSTLVARQSDDRAAARLPAGGRDRVKVVAVTHIDMRRDFSDKDKIDVNLEVSTYSKENAGEGRRQRRRRSATKKGS